MANKRKRRKLRLEAAARKQEDRKVTAPAGKRWDASKAHYVSTEEPEQFVYDVAAQLESGKPLYTGCYKAPNDEDLIELVCKMLSVSKESDLAVLHIHKHLPDRMAAIIRENGKWPTNCAIIRTKGITQRGHTSYSPVTNKTTVAEPIKPPVTPQKETSPVPAVVDQLMEKSIPRVAYTIKQAA